VRWTKGWSKADQSTNLIPIYTKLLNVFVKFVLWSAFGQPLVSLWSAFGQPLVSLWSAAREAKICFLRNVP
jgi:hypothetical protein